MINRRATKTAAAVLFVGTLVISSFIDDGTLHDGSDPVAAPLPQPRFTVQRRGTQLTLSGHTLSARHEKELLRAAHASPSYDTVDVHFEPLGTVPSYWQDATTKMIRLMAASTSANASLSKGSLSVSAVATDRSLWQDHVTAITGELPREIQVISDFLVVGPDMGVPAVCERVFSAFKPGPINFEESSDRFRSSAIPRLDRVIALANACRLAEITITGHSDGSGESAWNLELSLSRARAVADYLVARGIDGDRLKIVGAGATKPISDNNTRYGRSLNRRIEITFRNTG